MIGVIIVEENNGILRNVTEVNISEITKADVCQEQFDFDLNSFEDLLEYVEFQEYTDYLFVSLTPIKRLQKIVTFLNQHSEETAFHFISIEKSSDEKAEQIINRRKLQSVSKQSLSESETNII